MRRPVAGVGDGDSLQSWFQSIPMVTKIFFVGTLLTGGMTTFGMINPMNLIFFWENIRRRFEIWRLFTPYLFAGGFSFNYAMHLYMLYQNFLRYEQNPYNTGAGGTSADFLWLIMFAQIIHTIVGYIFDISVFSESILYVVMYVWSRREPAAILSMFGFKFQAVYLPWVYVAIRMLMGGSIMMPLLGVAIGHLYFFLVEVLPLSYGRNVITTPIFCIKLANWYTGSSSRPPTSGVAPTGTPLGGGGGSGGGRGGAGYNWGRGNVLGAR